MWDISKELFYKLQFLPLMKIRMTYGYNGNTNNSATAYTTITYSSASGSSINQPYADIVSPPNPELRWEKVKVINLGIDFESKNHRIDGSFEVYSKKGQDLIGPIFLNATTGFTSFLGNRASIKGNGIDIIINSRNIDGKVKWYTQFLLSHNRDRVTSYEQPQTLAANIVAGGLTLNKPLYSVYSFRSAGLDPINGDPRIILGDSLSSITNLSKATSGDLVYSGPANPTFFGSVRNTVSFADFSLSFNITYKGGYYFRRNSIVYAGLLSGSAFGGHSDYELRWQKPGDEATTYVPSLPDVSDMSRDYVYKYSDVLIEKGDHIRLQDIRVDYTINGSFLKKINAQQCMVYFILNNPGILWRANDKKIDPDYGDGLNGIIPPARSVVMGLRVNF
jgi:hypothetical protein